MIYKKIYHKARRSHIDYRVLFDCPVHYRFYSDIWAASSAPTILYVYSQYCCSYITSVQWRVLREINEQNVLIITFIFNDGVHIYNAMLQYFDFKEMLRLFIF